VVRVSELLIVLLGRARTAGLRITATGGRLHITGPREHGALARALLGRKPDLLPLVDVYNGRRRLLDWQAAAVRDPRPCVLCGSPALLRDPYDGVPMHRTCAERAVRWGLPTASAQGTAAA
jgi:hypothetical protein